MRAKVRAGSGRVRVRVRVRVKTLTEVLSEKEEVSHMMQVGCFF